GTVNAYLDAIRQPLRCVTATDHRREAKLTRDDCGVRERTAAVRDERAHHRQQHVERCIGGNGKQHIPLLEAMEVRGATQLADPTDVDALAPTDPDDAAVRVLRRILEDGWQRRSKSTHRPLGERWKLLEWGRGRGRAAQRLRWNSRRGGSPLVGAC